MVDFTLIEQHISSSPGIQHGKPCIKETRTPVSIILEAMAAGETPENIQKDFSITPDDINACILFAAVLANEEEIIPQPA